MATDPTAWLRWRANVEALALQTACDLECVHAASGRLLEWYCEGASVAEAARELVAVAHRLHVAVVVSDDRGVLRAARRQSYEGCGVLG